MPRNSGSAACCGRRTHVARRLRAGFRGAVVRDDEAAARKRFAIESYRSQLSRPQFDSVIRYGARMGGERIWGLNGLAAIPALEPAGLEAGHSRPPAAGDFNARRMPRRTGRGRSTAARPN